jgi:hypothetical protein
MYSLLYIYILGWEKGKERIKEVGRVKRFNSGVE